MAKDPLLSIITINLNNLKGLEKTMTNVFEQTWQEFEFIVIDGGSFDGSKEYIENHSSNIDHWVSERDNGIYNSMNKGIRAAHGKYLLFLNSGDHFYNDSVLKDCISYLRGFDIIYFNLNVVGGKRTYIKQYPDQLNFSYFIHESLPHPASFIKKQLFDRIGLYSENLKIVSDWKFFIESICKYDASYLRVDHTLTTFYLDGLSSLLENDKIIREEKQNVLQSNFKIFHKDMERLYQLESLVFDLRQSKKINFLIKIGLLKKF